MGNSTSQLTGTRTPKNGQSRPKRIPDLIPKYQLQSKSVDTQLHRIVKSRHIGVEEDIIDELEKSGRGDHEAKTHTRMTVNTNVCEVRSEPFILHDIETINSDKQADHPLHRAVEYESASNVPKSTEPFPDPGYTQELGGDVDKVWDIAADFHPKNSTSLGRFDSFGSARTSERNDSPALRLKGVSLKTVPRIDVPEAIEQSGEFPFSQNISANTTVSSITNQNRSNYTVSSSDANTSRGTVGIFSQTSMIAESNDSLYHRWSVTDPHAVPTALPDHTDIRFLPKGQSTSAMLGLVKVESTEKATERRRGLLTQRRIIKSSMLKYNSCSTLYVQGLFSNPNLREILQSLSRFLEHQIQLGDFQKEVKSEEIFSERLHPVSRQFQLYKTVPDSDTILKYLECLFHSAELSFECAIISLIYCERLLLNTGITLHPSNWARIVLGAIMLASKVWDDHAVWNVDFCQIFPDIRVSDMNKLERRYMIGLQYDVNVKLSTYTRYFFALHDYGDETRSESSLKPLNKRNFQNLESPRKPSLHISCSSSPPSQSQSALISESDILNDISETNFQKPGQKLLRDLSKKPNQLERTTSDQAFSPVNIPAAIL